MKVSPKAAKKLARWLAECLKNGWKKQDLDGLEKVWWKYRSKKTGELKRTAFKKSAVKP